MPRKPSSQPNELELRILRTLWDRGPSTAREVHEALRAGRQTIMSATTKMLQVMVDKGLLVRDDSERPIRFRPAVSQEATQAGIVSDVIDRVFAGAAEKLVLRAVEAGGLTGEQLAEIRDYIDRMEGEAR